jgi:hypothetical protein
MLLQQLYDLVFRSGLNVLAFVASLFCLAAYYFKRNDRFLSASLLFFVLALGLTISDTFFSTRADVYFTSMHETREK